MNLPLNRMAWVMVALFAPAGLVGWAHCLGVQGLSEHWTGQSPGPFSACFFIALIVSAAMGSLSWSEYIGMQEAGCVGGCLAYLWVPAVLLGGYYLCESYPSVGPPLCAAGYFLGVTLLMALMNPEGLTLILTLLLAVITPGLAEGCCPDSYRTLWGVGGFAVGFASSLLFGLLRHRWRHGLYPPKGCQAP